MSIVRIDEVLERLPHYRGRLPEISEATGLGYQWLCKLSQGQFKDPGARKIERLYDWMEANKQ